MGPKLLKMTSDISSDMMKWKSEADLVCLWCPKVPSPPSQAPTTHLVHWCPQAGQHGQHLNIHFPCVGLTRDNESPRHKQKRALSGNISKCDCVKRMSKNRPQGKAWPSWYTKLHSAQRTAPMTGPWNRLFFHPFHQHPDSCPDHEGNTIHVPMSCCSLTEMPRGCHSGAWWPSMEMARFRLIHWRPSVEAKIVTWVRPF